MFDMHTHLIHGVDDGSETIEETLEIIRQANALGIKTMVATPHFIKGTMDASREELDEKLNSIRTRLSEENIEMSLYLGNEIYVDFETVNDLADERCSTINDTKYLLLELPFQHELQNLEDLIFKLTLKNYVPILAHPERYVFIQKDLNKLERLIQMGVLTQLNLSSLNGRYGSLVQRTAEKLLKTQMVHFVGSDVHHKGSSALNIEPALVKVKKLVKPEVYEAIVHINGTKVIENDSINPFPILSIKKKRRWPKRVAIGVFVFIIAFSSLAYYGLKKVEAQFEAAMIQQAKAFTAAEKAAEEAAALAAEKKAEEERLAREKLREEERMAREQKQAEEDRLKLEAQLALEEELRAKEQLALAEAEKAKNEAERIAAEKAAEEARIKLEEEKKKAAEEAAKIEAERKAEEEKIAAAAKIEEERIETERLEQEKLIEEEKARQEAEMAAKYTDYETDKARALDLALSKLSLDQVNRLIELAAGGFEPEEKAEAKEMFYSNFTEEEQAWILEMYVKYYGS